MTSCIDTQASASAEAIESDTWQLPHLMSESDNVTQHRQQHQPFCVCYLWPSLRPSLNAMPHITGMHTLPVCTSSFKMKSRVCT